MDVALKPMEHVLFKSELALLADFRCRPDDPLFRDSGPSNSTAIAFPTTATKMLFVGEPPVHENPAAVSVLNRGDEYRRDAISEEGADCTWFTVHDDILCELMRGRSRFAAHQIPVSAGTILQQRRLLVMVRRDAPALVIEEHLLEILRAVLAHRPPPERINVRAVDRATEYLLANYTAPISLADIAREAGASPSYLSRAFHAAKGMTLSDFRQRLRLITSLDRLPHHAGNVTRLALDLGYSSHSHFTSAFRAMFKRSPSEWNAGC